MQIQADLVEVEEWEGASMVLDTVTRTTSLISKSLRLGPVMIVGVMLVFLSTAIRSDVSIYVATMGGLVVVLSASVEMFAYLQDSRRRFMKDRLYFEKQFQDASTTAFPFDEEINKLRLEVASIKNVIGHDEILTPQEREQLKGRLVLEAEKRIRDEAGGDILKKLSALAPPDHHIGSIRALTLAIQTRLSEEVSALGSRANVNLIIGNAISFIGVAVLGYFVFSFPTEMLVSGNGTELTIYFLSRLSLVAFIEVFAYFFLRLYRYSIFEIKYFQNEMTNAQFRAMSLEAALLKGDADTINAICKDLSKTERNFLLKKGDTTLALKELEAEQSRDKMVVEMVERTLNQWSKTNKGQHSSAAAA